MFKNKRVTELLKEMKKNHKKHIGLRYPDEGGNGELFGYATEDYIDVISGEFEPMGSTISPVFNRLHRWYLDNTQYQILKYQDSDTATDYFTRSSAYAYLLMYIGVVNFDCPNTKGLSYISIDSSSYYMGQNLICGWEEEYRQIGEWMIGSIGFGYGRDEEGNQTYKIISNGANYNTPGWFLLDLYCKVYDRSYDVQNADYPENLYCYEEVLEKWDTTDEIEIEKLTYMMCEYHLEETQESKDAAEEYFSFDDSLYWLFPVEILTWLKLREFKGLANPSTFSHPLMNTPIAKFFLSLDAPLSHPEEMPYTKVLLEKFKEKCPELEIPRWIKEYKIIPSDFEIG